jgi:dimethylhistidine N-methyltransferase
VSSKTIQKNLEYQRFGLNPRLSYFKPHAEKTEKSFAEEISHSLTQNSKFINPKFFYDQKGSQLFEDICEQPEYYLTRTEKKILELLNNELHEHLNSNYRLVELGSGSSVKTRLILDALDKTHEKIEYFPIDISDILKEGAQSLLEDYASLKITGIIDTYERGLELLKDYDDTPNLMAFLGSSFGNFCPEEGKEFLKFVNSTMKESDLFLIGLDLVKDKQILEDAYNDSCGVTAKFNLNVLSRINTELDANFNLDNFSHHSLFNEDKQRIEMYIRSHKKQSVHIPKANLTLEFEKDELIHTEHSHKYTISTIEKTLKVTGFQINRIWKDENSHFALVLASKN